MIPQAQLRILTELLEWRWKVGTIEKFDGEKLTEEHYRFLAPKGHHFDKLPDWDGMEMEDRTGIVPPPRPEERLFDAFQVLAVLIEQGHSVDLTTDSDRDNFKPLWNCTICPNYYYPNQPAQYVVSARDFTPQKAIVSAAIKFLDRKETISLEPIYPRPFYLSLPWTHKPMGLVSLIRSKFKKKYTQTMFNMKSGLRTEKIAVRIGQKMNVIKTRTVSIDPKRKKPSNAG